MCAAFPLREGHAAPPPRHLARAGGAALDERDRALAPFPPVNALRAPRRLALTVLLAVALGAPWSAAAAAANICTTLGLTAPAARSAGRVVAEHAVGSGRPICELSTRSGTAYASLYPRGDALALRTSWQFDLTSKAKPLPGPGADSLLLYTPGYRLEVVGVGVGSHYVWLTAAGEGMHDELLELATLSYAALVRS